MLTNGTKTKQARTPAILRRRFFRARKTSTTIRLSPRPPVSQMRLARSILTIPPLPRIGNSTESARPQHNQHWHTATPHSNTGTTLAHKSLWRDLFGFSISFPTIPFDLTRRFWTTTTSQRLDIFAMRVSRQHWVPCFDRRGSFFLAYFITVILLGHIPAIRLGCPPFSAFKGPFGNAEKSIMGEPEI